MYFGVIEWDSASSPSVVIGATPESLRRAAAQRLANSGFENDGDFNEPLAEDATDDEVTDWLDAFREACTVPWFTECGDGDAEVITAPDVPIDTFIPWRRRPLTAA